MDLECFDILVPVNDKRDPYHVFKGWLLGPYDHVAIYLGHLGNESYPAIFPSVFESIGRGVMIRDLRSWGDGVHVVVLRIPLIARLDEGLDRDIMAEAVRLASMTSAFYDYPAVIRWAIPRLILQKLHIPIPHTWRRDGRYICSEAVDQVLEAAGLDVLPDTEIPLPGDFVESPLLYRAGEGFLTIDPGVRPEDPKFVRVGL